MTRQYDLGIAAAEGSLASTPILARLWFYGRGAGLFGKACRGGRGGAEGHAPRPPFIEIYTLSLLRGLSLLAYGSYEFHP
jgi:hypothetical protein